MLERTNALMPPPTNADDEIPDFEIDGDNPFGDDDGMGGNNDELGEEELINFEFEPDTEDYVPERVVPEHIGEYEQDEVDSDMEDGDLQRHQLEAIARSTAPNVTGGDKNKKKTNVEIERLDR